MVLRWVDGFEGYGAGGADPAPVGVLADKYVGVNDETRMNIETANTRWSDSDYVLGMSDGAVYSQYLTPETNISGNTAIAGVGFYINNKDQWASAQTWPPLVFRNSTGGVNVRLVHTNGTFTIWGPNETYLGGTRLNIERFTYHYLEMKVYSHQSSGTVELRMNGCPVCSLSSVNTVLSAGNPSVRCGIGDNTTAIYCSQFSRFADFYVCDTTGNTCNDFLGPVRVETLWPDSDDNVNWTTTANSANHYENVNLLERDGTTDYVEESGSGVLDLFTLDNTSVTWDTIHGAVAWTAAAYSGSNANLQQVLSSNGTTSNSANITLTTAYLFDSPHIAETDPDTGNSWNSTTINALKSGFRTP